ncbi:MAG TPA: LuxR C-terminal-related transcriptional regulator [Bryobacteraceae bacterium]|jgi:DNA-binding NarL/FixJ family response regulator
MTRANCHDFAVHKHRCEEVRQDTPVANGQKNRDIADKLCISEHTVKAHLKSILEKLGADDRTDAAAIGLRRGFIQL